MKIGIEHAPALPAGTYYQHLVRILTRHAPDHEYIVDQQRYNEVEIYHTLRPILPFSIRWRHIPAVVTVANLNFMHHPHLYTLLERAFLLRRYRRTLRAANRLITPHEQFRKELSERLDIDRHKIDVILPLAALVPRQTPSEVALEAVRHKYDLPENFILMLGTIEPRHNHETIFKALLSTESKTNIVICGRRTTYSDSLLALARTHHMATQVDFIYELHAADLPALFALAQVFVYLPDAAAEASVVPLVEALRASVPMVLSHTPFNHDTAGDAALYVDPESVSEVAQALGQLLNNKDLYAQMQEREGCRAQLFSEYAVAQRLIDVYSSL